MPKLDLEVSDELSARLGTYCKAHKTTPSELFARLFGAYAKEFSLGDRPAQTVKNVSAGGNVYTNIRNNNFSVGDIFSNISVLNGVRFVFPEGGSKSDWMRFAVLVGFGLAVGWMCAILSFATM